MCNIKKTPKTLLPQKMEVIGTLDCVSPGPMLSGKIGNVGLVSFKCKTGVNLTIKEILLWIKKICPILQPFPASRSVVIFDNMSQHQKFQEPIQKWINEKRALLLWNPPNSPDLNCIEKC